MIGQPRFTLPNLFFIAIIACIVFLMFNSWVAADQSAENEDGFVVLTGNDGQSHWIGYGHDATTQPWPENWELGDGVLHAKGGDVDLRTIDEFDDFDLRFEWKIPPGGNSGVMYRVSQESEPAYHTGPEYQIFDAAGFADRLTPDTESAAVYGLYAPSANAGKPPGEWNEGRIVLRDNRVEHYLNGERVVECELGSDD